MNFDLCGLNYTFTLVRNPFARALSCYLDKICRVNVVGEGFRVRYNADDYTNLPFRDFLRTIATSSEAYDDQHWRPQAHNILLRAVPIDFVGHVEHLDEDLSTALMCAGVKGLVESSMFHATGAANRLGEWYGEEEREWVREKYAQDFKLFGYSKDPECLLPTKRRLAFQECDTDLFNYVRAIGLLRKDTAKARSCAEKISAELQGLDMLQLTLATGDNSTAVRDQYRELPQYCLSAEAQNVLAKWLARSATEDDLAEAFRRSRDAVEREPWRPDFRLLHSQLLVNREILAVQESS
ncbi:MAG: sulfotransferase family 2 domain-containing protein [Gammaproteobacteria bacterium]|nr:sulfotransferase family 2 domain-containing protein [Gammaproteobacteria bacterium]